MPGQIQRIHSSTLLAMADVSYGTVTRQCCLAYVPEAVVGDYVIVQTGFAISLLAPAEALEMLAAFHNIGILAHQDETKTSATPPASSIRLATASSGEPCTSWP